MMLSSYLLSGLFFLIAFLYAAVGSGGGSGYIAVMGIVGVEPQIIRPVALLLNVLVTTISTWKFVRAGHFSGRIFWPIALMSVPMAFLGGLITITTTFYRPFVGVILLYAAWRMWRSTQATEVVEFNSTTTGQKWWLAPISGAGIGLISGLLGIGGGIFLGPLLIFSGWASTRQAIGITAAFVLINSLAGLAGRLSVMPTLPAELLIWIPAVVIGGYLGAELAAHRFDQQLIRRLLAAVLVLGGLWMMF